MNHYVMDDEKMFIHKETKNQKKKYKTKQENDPN